MIIICCRFSQAILDVVVVAGPNSGGPVFAQDRYDAQVSEGAAVKSTVITVSVRIMLIVLRCLSSRSKKPR